MEFIKGALLVFGKLGMIVAIAFAFVIGLLGTLYWSFQSSEVIVPSVVGKSINDGETELGKVGLNVRRRATRYNPDVPANTILEQTPKPGEIVKAGQFIAVVLSRPVANEGESSVPIAGQNQNTNAGSENTQSSGNENASNDNAGANANSNTNRNRNRNANSNKNKNSNNSNANNSNNRNGNANNSNNRNGNANNRNANNRNGNANNRNANNTSGRNTNNANGRNTNSANNRNANNRNSTSVPGNPRTNSNRPANRNQ